jgi:ATP-dependent DNA ligase
VFDEHLVSRFEWLRGTKPTDLATPPIFMAFDALAVDRQDLRALPLTERRKMLEDVIEGQTLILPVRRLALNGAGSVAGSAEARVRGHGGEGCEVALRRR